MFIYLSRSDYHTEDNNTKTAEDTLVDVQKYSESVGIPYSYVLLDSWWYYKGNNAGVTVWDVSHCGLLQRLPTLCCLLLQSLGVCALIAAVFAILARRDQMCFLMGWLVFSERHSGRRCCTTGCGRQIATTARPTVGSTHSSMMVPTCVLPPH